MFAHILPQTLSKPFNQAHRGHPSYSGLWGELTAVKLIDCWRVELRYVYYFGGHDEKYFRRLLMRYNAWGLKQIWDLPIQRYTFPPSYFEFASMSATETESLILNILSQAVTVKYTFVSAVILLLYDTIINIPDEINFIWKQRWSVGKVLYIFTRYSCFFDAAVVLWYSFSASLSSESCRVLYEMSNWSMTVGVIMCQVVFIIRTYAILGKNNLLLAYLSAVEVTAVVASIIELNQSNRSVIFVASPSQAIVPCVPILGNNKLFICFSIVMIVELNILCLSLIKGFSQWKRESTPLVHTLYCDGVVYFAVLFSISLMNLIFVLKTFNTPYFYIVAEPQRVFHSVLASRVIINHGHYRENRSRKWRDLMFMDEHGDCYSEYKSHHVVLLTLIYLEEEASLYLFRNYLRFIFDTYKRTLYMSTSGFDLLFNELTQAVNVKYVFVSAEFLLFYDAILNIPSEKALIWSQRWTLAKVLYVIARYGCFIDAANFITYTFSPTLSPKSCHILYQVANWLMITGVNLAQVILLLRTYAVCFRNRLVLVYLCVIQIAALIACGVLVYKINLSIIFESSPTPSIVSCIPILGDKGIFVNYCIIMAVELNLFLVMVVKGFSLWRRESTPLIHTLYRDGVVYFVVLFLVALLNVVCVERSFNTPYFYIATAHERVFHSILASRVILNVRKAAASGVDNLSSTNASKSMKFRDIMGESINFSSGVSAPQGPLFADDEDERDS
ncbi:hypothetical protein SCHPADRAFT_943474 [Schizopora paradoxa]|uniref:DUF6533 domain-containing protein n=1 Tax=Schizopora paradoxa TaxID=27342 RepID=A0A0H2RDP5_9AGAM|nr:hypothetical protein SCHPADRAFT_943474 [Schizopora paradoxa]